LAEFPSGTPLALESVGNWYWIADEIADAGCVPLLTHAAKAKVMMGNVNKIDKLDAKRLAVLLRNGTLPTVWLPPGEIRDGRELHRTRMAFNELRTALKNRVQATLAKHALSLDTDSDMFAPSPDGGAPRLASRDPWLHAAAARCPRSHPRPDHHARRARQRADRSHQEYAAAQDAVRVANILCIVIEREMGCIDRFPSAAHFASYAGTVPTVKASGGKTRHGRLRKQSTRTSNGPLLKPPTSSSASATTPTGAPSMWCSSLNAFVAARGMPSPSAPWHAISQKRPSGW
jgi:transposase